MLLEQNISKMKLEEKVGNIYEVLIDEESKDNKYYIGRSYMDIPNEDGVIYIPKTRKNLVGKFINCKIVSVLEYDLIGELLWLVVYLVI